MDTRTEYVMFGDSFVKMFGLIRHRKLQTIGYKGASAKGLGRHSCSENSTNSTNSSSNSSSNTSRSTYSSNNNSRSRSLSSLSSNSGNPNSNTTTNAARDIQYRLQRMTSLKECYFNFGQVDVHLSYYYKTYGGGPNHEHEAIDLDDIARRYVDFVANLQMPKNKNNNMRSDDEADKQQQENKKTIVGVYPSAPDDEYVRQALVAYGSLSEEQSAGIPTVDVLLQTRQDRVMRFNAILQQACLERQINFVDCFDDLCETDCHRRDDDDVDNAESDNNNDKGSTTTTTDTTGTVTSTTTTGVGTTGAVTTATGIPRLRDEYRDISKCNIHLVWETTLLLWMRRLPWLSSLAPPGFEQELQETFAKYADTKPWADKDHGSNVCQHLLQLNGMSISSPETSTTDESAAASSASAASAAAAAVSLP
jgi:hypothetical protein